MVFGSTGSEFQFRCLRSSVPWNKPQSTSSFFPAASTRYFEPVTHPAAPKKVSFVMAPAFYPNAPFSSQRARHGGQRPDRGGAPVSFSDCPTRIVQSGAYKIKMPSAPYSEEAVKKHVEGTVVPTIVVNAHGRVSEAKVKRGPPELIQAALDSTTLWEFVAPNPAPFTDTVSVSCGFPKECPGSEASAGSVEMRSGLRSEKGSVIGMDEDLDQHLPASFESDWRAGAAGRMMLSITVDASGKVTQVSVVKPLSADLDRTTAETVRA